MKTLENSFYVFFDYSLEEKEFMFIYQNIQKKQHRLPAKLLLLSCMCVYVCVCLCTQFSHFDAANLEKEKLS